jgi:exonuclease SbcC
VKQPRRARSPPRKTRPRASTPRPSAFATRRPRASPAAEAALADLEARYRAAAETAKERGTLEAALAVARADLAELQRADVAATEAVTAIAAARDELATLPAPAATDTLTGREHDLVEKINLLERARSDHDAAVLRIRAAEAERQSLLDRADTEQSEFARLRDAAAELDQAPHDEARCDRCQQTLNAAARALAVESMRREANTHAEASERLRGLAGLIVVEDPPAEPPASAQALVYELATVRKELARVQAAAQQRARVEERVRQLQPTVDKRPAQTMIDAAAQACLDLGELLDDLEPVDLDTIARDGTAARARVTELRQQHQARAAIAERFAARLEQIGQAEQQLALIDTRARILRAEVDLCVQLEKAYGRDGIPALVIENSAIPSIETEADRILAALAGSTASCTVELRTQATRKTDQGLRDTLDVVIVGDQGERAYETFSGGERTRINLALRIALARLLAHRRGAESRLLAIDEPEFLDEQGTGALVEVLRGLQGDFDKLYIVSHVPSLRDSFDEVIAVVKDGDQSRIADIDAAVEAVAA